MEENISELEGITIKIIKNKIQRRKEFKKLSEIWTSSQDGT